MKVRKFLEKDAEQTSQVISKTVNVDQSLIEQAVKQIKEHTTPKALIERSKTRDYFVCEDNNKILGVGVLNKNEVRTMYTLKKYQNKGIGKNILKKIEQQAKLRKIKKLILYTHPSVEKFYNKCGFSTIKKFKDGEMNVVYMEKELK